jgi:type II secretory pathway pseudopilin PulG
VQTAIGAIIGILATVLVSRYYFHRSTVKRLSAFSLLVSHVFEGIDAHVRERLRFTFGDEVVDELSQVGFLIANTGERAISAFIESPRLELPRGSKVLDASIEYRNPEDLRVSLRIDGEPPSQQTVTFDVPLLNTGEYFAVRLLINGTVRLRDLHLRLLGDDLPREIMLEPLPFQETMTRRTGVDWGAIAAGTLLLGLGFSVGYSLWLLHRQQAELFALPWSSFRPSLQALPTHVAVAVVALLGIIGAAIGIGAGFGDAFARKPRFPLPSHIGRGPTFSIETIHSDMLKALAASDESVAETRPDSRLQPTAADAIVKRRG